MRRRDAQPDPEAVHGLRELEAALAGEPAADPDLALLVADVRAARPQADPQFLASLDARVHAGFPKERETPKRRTRPPWHARLRAPEALVPGVAATLIAGVIAVGIATSGGGVDDDSSGSAGGGTRAETLSSAAGSSSEDASSSSSASSSASSAPSGPRPAVETQSSAAAPKAATTRKVERGAALTLTPAPDDVQDVADGVIRETQAGGGYVQESSIQTRDDGGSASFTLRIPTARLDATLANLSKLAHVGALDQASTDITAQTASAADRLADARAERRALLQALGRATTDARIRSLKARLADNRAEIARRQSAVDFQRRRATMAVVTVSVEGTGKAVPKDDGGWTPGDALHDAGRVLEVAVSVALVALAVLVPLGVLALLAWLAAGAVRRRRREAALDGAR